MESNVSVLGVRERMSVTGDGVLNASVFCLFLWMAAVLTHTFGTYPVTVHLGDLRAILVFAPCGALPTAHQDWLPQKTSELISFRPRTSKIPHCRNIHFLISPRKALQELLSLTV